MQYGYVRISTPSQNIERQIRNIHRRYPVAIIVEEVYTGRTLDRPKWRKLLKQLRPGDIIIFDSVFRMARDAEEGFEEYQKLYAMGIELIFLQEPHINTEVYCQAANYPSRLPQNSRKLNSAVPPYFLSQRAVFYGTFLSALLTRFISSPIVLSYSSCQ